MGDGRTVMFLAGAVRLAIQIEEPTRGRKRRTGLGTSDRHSRVGHAPSPSAAARSVDAEVSCIDGFRRF